MHELMCLCMSVYVCVCVFVCTEEKHEPVKSNCLGNNQMRNMWLSSYFILVYQFLIKDDMLTF